MERSIILGGMKLRYELERKKVKNVNLRVRPDGSIYVSANSRVPVSFIESFMHENEAYILNALSKVREKNCPAEHHYLEGELFPFLGDWLPLHLERGNRASCSCDGITINVKVKDTEDSEQVKKALNSFYRRECEKVVEDSCRRIYPVYAAKGIAWPEISYRFMKSKWGCCRPTKGSLCFNCALVYTPIKCIDYVVAHEFTHFIHADHSKSFYAELERVFPRWKECKKLLNDFSPELMR